MISGQRHRGLFAAVTLAGWVCGAAAPSAMGQPLPRPNIVVVLVDDMRWDDFAAGGHPFVETPNIDRIAREGARFLNAFSTTPLCSPSRASFLTGLYAHTHGITDNLARVETSHRLPSFPRALRAGGYETAFIGKWHMGNDDTPRPGFDYWAAMRGQGETIDPQLNVNGTRQATKGYVTDVLTDHALRFIERDRTAPFLLYLSHKALHPNIVQRDDGSSAPVAGQRSGFIAAERHAGRYANAPIARRPNARGPVTDKPALQRPISGLPALEPGKTGTTDETIRERLEMLLAVDESLGRILETLERKGKLDDTVLVFTSDHGYFYGEHGLGGERRLAYEETARIPLLIRYPRLARAGATPGQLVLSLDVAATLLDLAGVPAAGPLDGRSLVPILRGQAQGWRSAILIEYFSDTVFPRIRNMAYQAVRTDRYKYIHYTELEGMDELYDLEADPYEMHSIIDSPTGRAILPDLKAQLANLLRDTNYSPTRSSAPRQAR